MTPLPPAFFGSPLWSGLLSQGYLCSSKGWVRTEIGWSRGEFGFAANDPKWSPRVWSHQWKAEGGRVIHRSEWVAKVTTATLWLFSCLWIMSKFTFCGFFFRDSPSPCSRGTQQSSNHCPSLLKLSLPQVWGSCVWIFWSLIWKIRKLTLWEEAELLYPK